MIRGSHDDAARKADRALELFEKGIKPAVIAERLGVRPTHVGGMLQRARQRREKAREAVE
jgi:DNA-binding transcriptional regulator LsrR (DeoR family)